MTKKRDVKANRKHSTRSERSPRGPSRRSSEVLGLVGLGASVLLLASLLSLQLGEGTLMGPVGRALAVAGYGLVGFGAYLLAFGGVYLSLRALVDKRPLLSSPQGAGFALCLVSLAILAQLCAGGYRVADLGPGGVIGEHVGELSRAVFSTAGTILFALLGLFVGVVVATPLRMRTVLVAIGAASSSVGSALFRYGMQVARDAAGFVADVVRAILPERDHDMYVDEHGHQDSDWADVTATDNTMRHAVAPPKPVSKAGPLDAVIVESITPKPKRKKPSNTMVGVVAQADSLEPGQMRLAAENAEASSSLMTEPIIVESQFKNPKAEELGKKAEQGDGERLDFIPLQSGDYKLPPVHLLDYDDSREDSIDRSAMLEMSARLTRTLENYGVRGEVAAIRPGPVVTMYEFSPAPGTRLNRIVNLADDLAMSLEALKVRIVAPIPGKAAVGIEVPNRKSEIVYLKEIIAHESFSSPKFKLPMALGKDIEGAPQTVDLARMPHLLVAGTTGSGKSVSVNSMITSLLYSSTPEDVRMIMVDPKMLELSIYEGVPHLLLPVVTDPKKANIALRWAVDEMEKRYDLLAKMGVRDIAGYNRKLEKEEKKWRAGKLQRAADQAKRQADAGDFDDVDVTDVGQMMLPVDSDDQPPRRLPYIVIVIDEFADLMMCAPKEVETSVARIAQKARAAGIHLILATQRPSVDVITGLIKANFPSRVAFRVASKIDSRTILDQGGAESLLGAGDMLFCDRGASPRRVHGCFIDEEEISRVVDFLKTQGRPVYNLDILTPKEEEGGEDGHDGGSGPEDEMYDQAVQIVAEARRVSVSYIQRRLSVGYNRAAKMVERMEIEGVVSPPDNKKQREVLISAA